VAWAEAYLHAKCRLDPSSHLATIDMVRKFGGSVPFWGGGAGFQSNTTSLGPSLFSYQVASGSIQPFGDSRYGPKMKVGLCLFRGGGAGSPSNTTWPVRGLPACQVSQVGLVPFYAYCVMYIVFCIFCIDCSRMVVSFT